MLQELTIGIEIKTWTGLIQMIPGNSFSNNFAMAFPGMICSN